MARIASWAMMSAIMAPVFLIGGWSVAAAVQPAGYNPLRDTISALAGIGANDRWIMTASVIGLGMCYFATALALRGIAGLGWSLLALGGAVSALVAVFPKPAVGDSEIHGIVAGTGFLALALWPALASRRGESLIWALRPRVATAVSAFLLTLLAWFAVELFSGGGWIGLTERFLAGAEVLWPLVVVAVVYRTHRRQHALADLGDSPVGADQVAR